MQLLFLLLPISFGRGGEAGYQPPSPPQHQRYMEPAHPSSPCTPQCLRPQIAGDPTVGSVHTTCVCQLLPYAGGRRGWQMCKAGSRYPAAPETTRRDRSRQASHLSYSRSGMYGTQTIFWGSMTRPAEPAALRCCSTSAADAQMTCCPFWYLHPTAQPFKRCHNACATCMYTVL